MKNKLIITKNSYATAVTNLALDALTSIIENDINDKKGALEAIEILTSYVDNSSLNINN